MTRFTTCPLMSRPRIARAASSASAGEWATFTPPALPRPPVLTCAFTTTVPPSSAATAAASSGVSAVRPGSTGTPCAANRSCPPAGFGTARDHPVSPFRPRRWRGGRLPQSATIVLDNLDPDKRPIIATADFRELVDIESVSIRQDLSSAVQLLFDPDHSLEERIIAEQFLA